MTRVIVTGGAGFIGSHLVDAIARKAEVVVIDNFSSGRREFLSHHEGRQASKGFKVITADLSQPEACFEAFDDAGEIDRVYHFAAEADVRKGDKAGVAPFQRNNLEATINVLEACREKGIAQLTFASTSAVYGNATLMPTPESYGPLLPISHYAASKLACEAFVSSYSDNYGIDSAIVRFANVIGGRQSHGVIFDFIGRLRRDSAVLEILGDGKQAKNYVHVDDCVTGVLAAKPGKRAAEIYNISSDGKTSVTEIADAVLAELGLAKKTKKKFTGKSWAGDVKTMMLDSKKLRGLGWTPKLDSKAAVKLAVSEVASRS